MIFDIEKIIKTIAAQENSTSENVNEEIQKAIDIAWSSENQQEIENQKKLFPNGKPTVEEFLLTIHDAIKSKD